MAKDDEPGPSCKPMHAARDVTVAECDDGIPPELSILLVSHFFSLYLPIERNKLISKKDNKNHNQNKNDWSHIKKLTFQNFETLGMAY